MWDTGPLRTVGTETAGDRRAARDQHAQPLRCRPAREPALHSERARAEVGVPEGGRRGGRRVRWKTMLRRAVHRALEPPLSVLVFVVGTGSLGAEIAAVRLLAPYFGASTIVWANTIGVVLVALSVGYWLGGRLADRHPNMRALCFTSLIAAVMLAIVPFAADPLLNVAVDALDQISAGAFLGSLVAVLVLVAVPVLLLGDRLALGHPARRAVRGGGGHRGRAPVRAVDGGLARGHARVGAPPDPARGHAPHLPDLRARDRRGVGPGAAARAALGARARGDRRPDRAPGGHAQGEDRGRRPRDPRGRDGVPVRAGGRVPERQADARAERGAGRALGV